LCPPLIRNPIRSRADADPQWRKNRRAPPSRMDLVMNVDGSADIYVGPKTFAVGMPVTRHPPRRSRRALLTHRAPASGRKRKHWPSRMSPVGQKQTSETGDQNVCFTPESRHKSSWAGMSALCHKQSFAVPEQPPQFGTSRCRWRSPSTASITDIRA
jgi:hypothetical protein